MADRYAATMQDAVSSGYLTAGIIGQAATFRTRLEIYDLLFSADGAPADNVLNFRMRRSTAAGTTTAVTPEPLEGSASGAATAAVGENATAEPTYTANSELMQFDLNQRATFRWVASPGGAFKVPAANSVGIGTEVKSPAYTGNASITAHFLE